MIEKLHALENFDANNFKIRKNRSLGKDAFGEVYACSFGYGDKLQCVLKVAKKCGEEDLMLEGRILKKIFDDSFDDSFLAITLKLRACLRAFFRNFDQAACS